MFSGFPSGHFSTSVYLNGPTVFSDSPCCSDYQSLNCSFAAMLPKKLPFAASADVSAEQSTPNLGLYMKMYTFTSPYVRDVFFILIIWYTLSDPFRIPNSPQKGK